MEEIKIGEYVRTNKGEIHKVTFILYPDAPGVRYAGQYLYETYYECENNDGCRFDKYDILKHSSNIIDLIEVGDYVNGEPVEQVTEFEITTTTEYLTNLNDIKSICTKEQFKSVEYRLED